MFIDITAEQLACSASSVLIKRSFGDVKDWDTCMDNKICKIVAIVVIVVGGLFIFWILSSIARCLCCGATIMSSLFCCCSQMCNCCGGGSLRKDYQQTPAMPPPASYQPYQGPRRYDPPQDYSAFTRKLGKPQDQLAPAPLPSQIFNKPPIKPNPPEDNSLYGIAEKQFGENSAYGGGDARKPLKVVNDDDPFTDSSYEPYGGMQSLNKPIQQKKQQQMHDIPMNDLSNVQYTSDGNSYNITAVPPNVAAANATAYNRANQGSQNSLNDPSLGVIRGQTNLLEDSLDLDTNTTGYSRPYQPQYIANSNSYTTGPVLANANPASSFSPIHDGYTGSSNVTNRQQIPFHQMYTGSDSVATTTSSTPPLRPNHTLANQTYNEVARIDPTSLIHNTGGESNNYASNSTPSAHTAAPYPTSNPLAANGSFEVNNKQQGGNSAPYPSDTASIFDMHPRNHQN